MYISLCRVKSNHIIITEDIYILMEKIKSHHHRYGRKIKSHKNVLVGPKRLSGVQFL
jgi:hypothetical protein